MRVGLASPAIFRSSATGPRILYLTPFWPHHCSSASELRSTHVIRALQRRGHVSVVVVGEESAAEDRAVHQESQVEVACHVPVRAHPNIGLFRKIDWIVNPRSTQPHGLAADEDTLETFLARAGQFDLVWFHTLRAANTFRQWAWPRSVVDVNDVPSTFERSVLDAGQSTGDRCLTAVRLWSWQRRERLLGERFTGLTVCSETDRQYLARLGVTMPVRVVPNGYEKPLLAPVRRPADPPRLGFIGVFDHAPNVAGIRWFVRECWPRIKRDIPNARLRLVGRFSDGPLTPTGPDIDALGWLDDPAAEMSTWASMVVPVHIGAGTRGKIAHAFSQKCPVVSTSLGAYGYGASDGDTMLLAESAETFADACLRTVRQPASASAMAERAWQQFLDRWTWDSIRPSVWAAVDDCLESPARLRGVRSSA